MTVPSRKTPELLAPAGGHDAFVAAIANGADAVYLGVDRLNARRSAENFTVETLAETCRFAHIRGVRVYLTVNVVVLPAEIAGALELVDEAWAAGVDAVIVQDLGLLWAVQAGTAARARPLVDADQRAQHATVEALESLGVSRVTLAREVSLDEIAGFAAAGPSRSSRSCTVRCACCYSGQCLMSSLIGGRSANRGQCAQPCRMTYELVDGSGAVIATPGAHLLSPKDLAGIAVLPRLVEAGVSALKIEGRMKNPEYVALVTGVYRSALDRAAADPEGYVVRDGETAVLVGVVLARLHRGVPARRARQRDDELPAAQQPRRVRGPRGRIGAGAATDRPRIAARRRGHRRVLDVVGTVRAGGGSP